jgi:hypothetical protein
MAKKKPLPPKKLGPKGRPAPEEQDDEAEDEPDEDEGDEGPQGEAMDEGDDSDGEQDDDEQTEEQHEVSEDQLIAIMQQTLHKLEMLQHQVHGLSGGAPQGMAPGMVPGQAGPAPVGVDPLHALVAKAMGQ